MLNLNLEEPQLLPEVYLGQLARWDTHFKLEVNLAKLTTNPSFRQLVEEIDAFCLANRVIGFHFTHGFREDFLKHGLLVRSGAQSRAEFMYRFGEHFTAAQRDAIRAAWAQYFTADQRKVRDSRVSFNFTTMALDNGGAERSGY